jgi:flagellar biosynthesis/type III secretory pathway M-ring protein FliF/YscJ
MKRKPWQYVESRIRRKSRGRLTPGSGNKKIKGDVHAGSEGWSEDDQQRLTYEARWSIESKSTRNDAIIVQALWFEKLLKESKEKTPALVLTFTQIKRDYPFRIALEEETPTTIIEINRSKRLHFEEIQEGLALKVGENLWCYESPNVFFLRMR